MYDDNESTPPPTWRSVLAETRAVYRLADQAYAPYSCPATSECCQLTQRGRQPWLWPSEWKLLEEAARTQWGQLPPERTDGGCPFLTEDGQRCRVYADRPFGCRTFFCHRGVGPTRQPLEQVVELSRRLEFLNLRWNPEVGGPSELLKLYAQARHQR